MSEKNFLPALPPALLFFFFLLAFCCKAVGQDLLQQPITVAAENTELRKVLDLVQDQTNIKFTYSSDFIGAGKKVSCNLRHQKLAVFFDEVLLPLGIRYRVIDSRQVLLFRPQVASQGDGLSVHPAEKPAKRVVAIEVKSHAGLPLPGVSVVERGSGNGMLTDANGRCRITVKPSATLQFSLVGYVSREVPVDNSSAISLTLGEEIRSIDEVIITGVFDQSRRMESAVAITTLNESLLSKQVPVSTADILHNVPGVFVNSSLGEIRNIVYSRGVSANSTEAAFGYYYVSFQEDGLPVTNVTFSNFGPDYFCRPDATLKRVEAVRAGTSSILGSNAPGGIFNYISKTGGKEFAGLARARYGIEGDGNSYYRAEVNIGGPVNQNGWFYNAGGFYRYNQGARYAGYPLNRGGQFKGNLVKEYKGGSLKFFVKYLNDRNGWFEVLHAKDFHHPRRAPGVKQTDTYLLPDAVATYPFLEPGNTRTFDPTTLTHSRELALGLQAQHMLGKGWKLINSLKFSDKKQNWQSSSLIYPLPVDSPNLYNLLGTLGRAGTYSFRDRATGAVLGQAYSPDGYTFSKGASNLPGAGVIPGGVLTQLGYINQPRIKEVIDQLLISKKIRKMNFTAGAFFAHSSIRHMHTLPALGIGTIQHRPHLLDVTLTTPAGRQLQVTNDQGYANLGGILELYEYRAVQHDQALFFEHSWQLHQKLKLNWAFRFEQIRVEGNNHIADPNPRANDPAYGGADGNPATLYDNRFFVRGATYAYDRRVTTFSYSSGLNYKISDHFAVYARYSKGQKAPDLSYYFSYDSRFKLENDRPRPQHTVQAEVGLVAKRNRSSLFVTPFFSLLRNVVFSYAPFEDGDRSLYFPLPLYNSMRTIGVEWEMDWRIFTPLQVRAIATFQTAKTLSWKNWVANGPGRQDDQIKDYSGTRADNNPRVMLNLTPAYTTEKYYGQLSWKFMGNRPGNIPQTVMLPQFSQFDLGAGWNITKRYALALNINNLFNSEGVMSWAPPGGYPTALDRQGFTRDKLEANLNAPFGIICIQPRSYFLTFSCTF
ncbi:TonB-dependent receptor [Paraflavisolibacter sp. H34]|uniref:TonB-dependent receptor n=1 Tax=Huijunlia imazamoxiresistens TaxID=3127457 RepID=UPI003019D18F